MASYTIKIFPSKSFQFSIFKALMKALNIRFEVTEEKPYNPEFVKKILESERQIEKGNCTTVNSDDFDKFLWK